MDGCAPPRPEDLPAPPVPADADLTGFGWFPLHHKRLKQSEWWLSASDLARSRNVDLWAEAFEQVPAASLPDSDVILAKMAGFGRDIAGWRMAKAEIMAPWTLCSDGRWYHPTLAEVALASLDQLAARTVGKSKRVEKARKAAEAKWGRASEEPSPQAQRQTRSERLAAARTKGTHRAEDWAALLSICGPRCLRCGAEAKLVKDHITPIYRGGSDGIWNVQPLCQPCNSSKGPEAIDLRPSGWEKRLLERLPDACTAPADACHNTDTDRTGQEVEADASPSDARPRDEGEGGRLIASIVKAYADQVIRGRGSPMQARSALLQLSTDDLAKVLAAIPRYAEARPWGSGGPPSLERFVREEVWADFVTSAEVISTVWSGPAAFRAAVVNERGESFARSYLDPAEWRQDGDDVEIVALSSRAAEQLQTLLCLADSVVVTVKKRQA